MADAIVPILGIRRNAQTVWRVGQKCLMGIPWSLRSAELGKVSYRRINDLLHLACGGETDFPKSWDHWRADIAKFNLNAERSLPRWIPALDAFIKMGWAFPQILALAQAPSITAACTDDALELAAAQLWTAAVLLFADVSSSSYIVLRGGARWAQRNLRYVSNDAARTSRFLLNTTSVLKKRPIGITC